MTQEYEKYPDNPVKISKKARKIFRELYKSVKATGSWSDGFEYSLSVLAQAYAHYDECLTEIEREGMFYESATLKRKHPAFELMKECVQTIKDLSNQFKLAPRFRDKKDVITDSEDPVRKLLKQTDSWTS